MTDEPMIERLERLEAAATPGPWEVEPETEDGSFLAVIADADAEFGGYTICQSMEDEPNAALIVAMRNALPSLLSELKEARGALGRADGLLEIEREKFQKETLRATVLVATTQRLYQALAVEVGDDWLEHQWVRFLNEGFPPDERDALRSALVAAGMDGDAERIAALAPDTEEGT